MTINLKAIRAAAEAATPGPWEAAGPSFGAPLPKYLNCVGWVTEDDEFEDVCTAPLGSDGGNSADMAYIATANPAAILELLDMLGETLAGRFAAFHASERELMDTRDELLAALNDAVQIAKTAHEYWDSDQDSKVGKYLMALAGYLPGYSGLTDGVHKAIASAKGGTP